MSKVNSVLSTNDFSIFEYSRRNRDLKAPKVRKLVKSIEARDKQLVPVIVRERSNGKLEVMDGQHRIEACRLLGRPVVYIIDNDYVPSDITEVNNTQNKWSPMDYIESHEAAGKKPYQYLMALLEKTGFSVGTAYLILKGKSMTGVARKELFEGDLQIETGEIAAFNKKWALIKDMTEVNDGAHATVITATKFVRALLYLINHPDYNHSRWLYCLKTMKKGDLQTINKTEDGVRDIENLYNYNNKTKRVDLISVLRKEQFAEKESV